MTFDLILTDYLHQVEKRCRQQLEAWYGLDALPPGLQPDALSLTALHFLHTAIDRNEGATGPRQDYLLVLPDAKLSEEVLRGALLGALLSKYRANYITASPVKVAYASGDILLRIKKNGETELRQVVQVDAAGGILKLTRFPNPDGLRDPAPHRNFVRLLPADEANQMGFGAYGPAVAQRLAANMNAIRGLLKDVDGQVAALPHRLGLICKREVIDGLQAVLPLPVRYWRSNGNGHLHLPLAPLVEAARSYSKLKAFAEAKARPVCDELLIFDADKYCDGNGLFDQIREGRGWQNYRNLVLVGSRRPRADHDFRSWEWTPEELALLRGLPCRLPQVVPCVAPAVRAAHEALCQRIGALAVAHGPELKALLRGAALFYRLVLPLANGPSQQEPVRQTAGLLAWVRVQLESDEVFAAVGIGGVAREQIRAELLILFETLAQAVASSGAKFEAVRAACAAPAPANWPKGKARRGKLPPVVLVLPRRDVAAAEVALRTALQAVLLPDQVTRLRVMPVQRLAQAIAAPALNRPGAVWLLPSLRFGRQTPDHNELSLYRQLLLLQADVRLLAYAGVDEGRATQLAARHAQLVETALLHPGRAHFVGELRPELPARPVVLAAGETAPATPPAEAELPPLTYTPQLLPDPEAQANFDELDDLFGPLPAPAAAASPLAAFAWRPVSAPSAADLAADDLTDAPEPDLTDDDSDDDETVEHEGQNTPEQAYTLRFANGEEKTLPATARVYARLPPDPNWQPRTPPQLLSGDEVLLIVSNPGAIRVELVGLQPEKMQEIDEMSKLWKDVLRRLCQRFFHSDVAALHRKLQFHGLSVHLQSVTNWLNTTGSTRFPEAWSDLQALADLEARFLKEEAQLAPQLERLRTARRANDRAVAGYSRSFNAQLKRYLKDNRAVPTDPELARLLGNTRPRLLHSVVPAGPNHPTDPLWFLSF